MSITNPSFIVTGIVNPTEFQLEITRPTKWFEKKDIVFRGWFNTQEELVKFLREIVIKQSVYVSINIEWRNLRFAAKEEDNFSKLAITGVIKK